MQIQDFTIQYNTNTSFFDVTVYQVQNLLANEV